MPYQINLVCPGNYLLKIGEKIDGKARYTLFANNSEIGAK